MLEKFLKVVLDTLAGALEAVEVGLRARGKNGGMLGDAQNQKIIAERFKGGMVYHDVEVSKVIGKSVRNIFEGVNITVIGEFSRLDANGVCGVFGDESAGAFQGVDVAHGEKAERLGGRRGGRKTGGIFCDIAADVIVIGKGKHASFKGAETVPADLFISGAGGVFRIDGGDNGKAATFRGFRKFLAVENNGVAEGVGAQKKTQNAEVGFFDEIGERMQNGYIAGGEFRHGEEKREAEVAGAHGGVHVAGDGFYAVLNMGGDVVIGRVADDGEAFVFADAVFGAGDLGKGVGVKKSDVGKLAAGDGKGVGVYVGADATDAVLGKIFGEKSTVTASGFKKDVGEVGGRVAGEHIINESDKARRRVETAEVGFFAIGEVVDIGRTKKTLR